MMTCATSISTNHFHVKTLSLIVARRRARRCRSAFCFLLKITVHCTCYLLYAIRNYALYFYTLQPTTPGHRPPLHTLRIPSRQCNFSSSRRYMDRYPRFLHQMAHKLLRLIYPYLPHNNLRLRREVAFTTSRAHPVDCPVGTYRPLSKPR